MSHRSFIIVAVVALLSLVALPVRAQETYNVDPVHSAVVFQIRHFDVGNFWGRFNGPSGTFVLDKDDPSKSTFSMKLTSESVSTGNEQRDGHLKSEDFFNIARFPEIAFASTSVKPVDEGLEVSGELTLLAVSRPITITLKKIGEGETRSGYRAGFEGEITIKRGDFGMNFMQGPGGLGDEVRLIIAFEGVRQ